jgi:hypothetical protein
MDEGAKGNSATCNTQQAAGRQAKKDEEVKGKKRVQGTNKNSFTRPLINTCKAGVLPLITDYAIREVKRYNPFQKRDNPFE